MNEAKSLYLFVDEVNPGDSLTHSLTDFFAQSPQWSQSQFHIKSHLINSMIISIFFSLALTLDAATLTLGTTFTKKVLKDQEDVYQLTIKKEEIGTKHLFIVSGKVDPFQAEQADLSIFLKDSKEAFQLCNIFAEDVCLLNNTFITENYNKLFLHVKTTDLECQYNIKAYLAEHKAVQNMVTSTFYAELEMPTAFLIYFTSQETSRFDQIDFLSKANMDEVEGQYEMLMGRDYIPSEDNYCERGIQIWQSGKAIFLSKSEFSKNKEFWVLLKLPVKGAVFYSTRMFTNDIIQVPGYWYADWTQSNYSKIYTINMNNAKSQEEYIMKLSVYTGSLMLMYSLDNVKYERIQESLFSNFDSLMVYRIDSKLISSLNIKGLFYIKITSFILSTYEIRGGWDTENVVELAINTLEFGFLSEGDSDLYLINTKTKNEFRLKLKLQTQNNQTVTFYEAKPQTKYPSDFKLTTQKKLDKVALMDDLYQFDSQISSCVKKQQFSICSYLVEVKGKGEYYIQYSLNTSTVLLKEGVTQRFSMRKDEQASYSFSVADQPCDVLVQFNSIYGFSYIIIDKTIRFKSFTVKQFKGTLNFKVVADTIAYFEIAVKSCNSKALKLKIDQPFKFLIEQNQLQATYQLQGITKTVIVMVQNIQRTSMSFSLLYKNNSLITEGFRTANFTFPDFSQKDIILKIVNKDKQELRGIISYTNNGCLTFPNSYLVSMIDLKNNSNCIKFQIYTAKPHIMMIVDYYSHLNESNIKYDLGNKSYNKTSFENTITESQIRENCQTLPCLLTISVSSDVSQFIFLQLVEKEKPLQLIDGISTKFDNSNQVATYLYYTLESLKFGDVLINVRGQRGQFRIEAKIGQFSELDQMASIKDWSYKSDFKFELNPSLYIQESQASSYVQNKVLLIKVDSNSEENSFSIIFSQNFYQLNLGEAAIGYVEEGDVDYFFFYNQKNNASLLFTASGFFSSCAQITVVPGNVKNFKLNEDKNADLSVQILKAQKGYFSVAIKGYQDCDYSLLVTEFGNAYSILSADIRHDVYMQGNQTLFFVYRNPENYSFTLLTTSDENPVEIRMMQLKGRFDQKSFQDVAKVKPSLQFFQGQVCARCNYLIMIKSIKQKVSSFSIVVSQDPNPLILFDEDFYNMALPAKKCKKFVMLSEVPASLKIVTEEGLLKKEGKDLQEVEEISITPGVQNTIQLCAEKDSKFYVKLLKSQQIQPVNMGRINSYSSFKIKKLAITMPSKGLINLNFDYESQREPNFNFKCNSKEDCALKVNKIENNFQINAKPDSELLVTITGDVEWMDLLIGSNYLNHILANKSYLWTATKSQNKAIFDVNIVNNKHVMVEAYQCHGRLIIQPSSNPLDADSLLVSSRFKHWNKLVVDSTDHQLSIHKKLYLTIIANYNGHITDNQIFIVKATEYNDKLSPAQAVYGSPITHITYFLDTFTLKFNLPSIKSPYKLINMTPSLFYDKNKDDLYENLQCFLTNKQNIAKIETIADSSQSSIKLLNLQAEQRYVGLRLQLTLEQSKVNYTFSLIYNIAEVEVVKKEQTGLVLKVVEDLSLIIMVIGLLTLIGGVVLFRIFKLIRPNDNELMEEEEQAAPKDIQLQNQNQ